MKKRFETLLLFLIALLIVTVPISAAQSSPETLSPDTWGQDLPLVTDQAGILSPDQRSALTARAQELSQRYGCNIYIITLDDMWNFYSPDWGVGGLNPIEACAEELRTGYDLGYGAGKDCVMLLLSMAERDYDLLAYGDFGNYAFTDYGKGYIAEQFLGDFRRDDWTGGFEDYLDCCGEVLRMAAEGTPLDVGTRPVSPVLSFGASLLVSFLIALAVCSVMRSAMKPTAEQTEAVSYIPAGGASITFRRDTFLNRTEQRVYDPQTKSGGSGGGTTVSSSGHSHSSGKF